MRDDYVLRFHHHLDSFAIVHGAITVRNVIKADGPIEYAAGLDFSVKNIRQKLLDISPHGSRPAADRYIVIKRRLRSGNSLLLGNANAPHRAARTSDADRG